MTRTKATIKLVPLQYSKKITCQKLWRDLGKTVKKHEHTQTDHETKTPCAYYSLSLLDNVTSLKFQTCAISVPWAFGIRASIPHDNWVCYRTILFKVFLEILWEKEKKQKETNAVQFWTLGWSCHVLNERFSTQIQYYTLHHTLLTFRRFWSQTAYKDFPERKFRRASVSCGRRGGKFTRLWSKVSQSERNKKC